MAMTGVPRSPKMSMPSWIPMSSHFPLTRRRRGACQLLGNSIRERELERATGNALPCSMTGRKYAGIRTEERNGSEERPGPDPATERMGWGPAVPGGSRPVQVGPEDGGNTSRTSRAPPARSGRRPLAVPCTPSVTLRLEEPFGVDGRLASHPRGCDGLSVDEVDDVSRGEDAVHARPGGGFLDHDVAVGHLELAREERRVRRVPDGHEDSP